MPTILPMLSIDAIPAFTDNYIWMMHDGVSAVVIDPGDARPVLQALESRSLRLQAVLVTHWHPDHIGGITELTAQHPAPVYAPRAESARIPQTRIALDDGERVEVLGRSFQVIAVPGHTLGHIAYFSDGVLFCGDTLFSAGCGRLFEGTPAQMHASLQKLAALPPETQVYCTHEYTTSNLAFAQAVEPQNPAIAQRIEEVKRLREANLPSLPTTLAQEFTFNPFLRCTEPRLIAAIQPRSAAPLTNEVEVFAILRVWKDAFRA